MRFDALVYFYRRRLRVHAVQELLAGLGVAIGVALVLATTIASHSIAGSAREVVHTVIGPATVQVRARSTGGFDERLLAGVEHLPGVQQAAPILEQIATIRAPTGRRVTVDLAGADTSLVVMDGLAHTLPIATLSPGGLGLSTTTAQALKLTSTAGHSAHLLLDLRGVEYPVKVSAILGSETFGALSEARVAVMPLADLQRLTGLRKRISRILIQTTPGAQPRVRSELHRLLGGSLDVAPANQDVAALKQALRPSDEASAFFATISALLGFLFAFNALLLTVPERRQSIAELRLNGTKSMAIVQMFAFQAIVLGIVASLVGVLGGYLLALGAFHQSTGYLAAAFTLSTHTVVGASPVVLSLLGGVIATCLASTVPLLDLRPGRVLDAVYAGSGVPGNALSPHFHRRLALAAAILLAAASAMFVLAPSLALLACAVLALASVCTVPLTFVAVLASARSLSERFGHLSILSTALTSLKGTTLRSLALAATGAVALFGTVALGGAHNDLLRGIHAFAHSYSADATIWVTNPGDNQATTDFIADGQAARVAQVAGVAHVNVFQGGFLEFGSHPPRRVWIIARPPGADRNVLSSQVTGGNVTRAIARLGEGGWVAVSKQIAEVQHVAIGGTLTLPTPTGDAQFRVAATTTNLAWPPGVIFMSTADYSKYWTPTHPSAPSALGVQLLPGANIAAARSEIERQLGASSGLEVATAATRQSSIDTLANEGLGQLSEISTMLLLAAILALVAGGTSAVWQRRASLAELRLDGVEPPRLRLILLVESALMLGAGCITGALAGVYGQLVIDGYLEGVTGFPVASLAASLRPLEIFVLVITVVVAIVMVPGWFASRVSPMLALND